MAFATEPIATVSIGMVDASGTRSKVTAHMASSVMADDALLSGVALATLIRALTDCEVQSVSVTYSSYDAASPDAVFPGASAEEKGRIITVAANGSYVRMDIPAIKDTFVDQQGAIPVTAAAVTALLNELTGGGWVSANGSDIVATHAAYKAYKRSTKNMLPNARLVT